MEGQAAPKKGFELWEILDIKGDRVTPLISPISARDEFLQPSSKKASDDIRLFRHKRFDKAIR